MITLLIDGKTGEASRKGFTLIELLTVIAIIGILAAILIPVVGSVRTGARIAQNVANLREIGSVLLLHADERGVYPPSYNPDTNPNQNWGTQVAMTLTGDGPTNSAGAIQHPILLSPVQYRGPLPEHNVTVVNYSANPLVMPSGNPNSNNWNGIRPEHILEPSRTILVGDARPRSADAVGMQSNNAMWFVNQTNIANAPSDRAVSWPADVLQPDATGAQGYPAFRNNGKAHFVFADGHVQGFLPQEITNGLYQVRPPGGGSNPYF